MFSQLRSGLSMLARRSGLLRSQPVEMDVALDGTADVYSAGDRVHATVSVRAHTTLHVREARLELVRRERYERRDGTDMDDEESERSTTADRVCLVDEHVVAEQTVMQDRVIADGARLVWPFAAALPVDAHPSWLGGTILDLAWLVRVMLKDTRGVVHTAQAELVVVGTGAHPVANEAALLQPDTAADMRLRFALAGKQCVTGQTITGHLVVESDQDGDVLGARVELERVETVHDGTRFVAREKWTTRPASRTHLVGGQTLALPFSILVPHPRPVSGRTAHSSVSWRLRGVLELGDLQPDVCAEEEIIVGWGRASA